MEVVHKQEYIVRDMGTCSVTLFPSRAQIVREIKDVILQPGVNEITVIGFTPTADLDSVRIEGTGSATISEITTEQLPNRESFKEIYPDTNEEDSEQSNETGDDQDPFFRKSADEPVDGELKAIHEKLVLLHDDHKRAKEIMDAATARLNLLEIHSKNAAIEDPEAVRKVLEIYRQERASNFEENMKGVEQEREALARVEEANKEERRLLRERREAERKANKEKEKAKKAKDKELKKEQRRKDEQEREKLRIRRERGRFWPKKVGCVRITLHANMMTPISSRRGSVTSTITELAEPDSSSVNKIEQAKPGTVTDNDAAGINCDLKITYLTSSAFWSPNYDVQLSTTTNTASIRFDAKLTNETSETWSNCKVSLSTSQATSCGLDETLPKLKPWHIKLASKEGPQSTSDILKSFNEMQELEAWRRKQKQVAKTNQPRHELFGVKHVNGSQRPEDPSIYLRQTQAHAASTFRQHQTAGYSNISAAGGLFGASTAQPSAAFQQRASTSGFGTNAVPAIIAETPADNETNILSGDEHTMLASQPELEFQESTVEEMGFTTTYDVPGLKTLEPRSTPSKQRVARVTLPHVIFSHTVVAKYKPVAYLKARLRNSGKLALLNGPAGMSLDGVFLGRTELPRCSLNDTMTLSLGVDPAIKVRYAQPDVRRASATGVFHKEDCSAYERSVTIANTRIATGGGKMVQLLFYDQVPVSEDEKLKVEMLHPKGMAVGDQKGVQTGAPGRESKDDSDWGEATATLKEEGEICWDVRLKPGKAVKLGLGYTISLPSGERATQSSSDPTFY